MAENVLQLNSPKTESLIIGPEHILVNFLPPLGNLAQHVVPTVQKLGVIINHNLNLKSHVKKQVQSCFFHLRNTVSLELDLLLF